MKPAASLGWSEGLSTGVAVLDEQHQAIFRWCGELERAAAEQRTLFAAYTIARLHDYMRAHFAAEEAFMRAAGFPKLAQHIAEHQTFRRMVGNLQVESIGRDITADTIDVLRTWLVGHICGHDLEYVPYLTARFGPERVSVGT